MSGCIVVSVCSVGPMVHLAGSLCTLLGLPASTLQPTDELFAMQLAQNYANRWESFFIPCLPSDCACTSSFYTIEFASADIPRLAKRFFFADVIFVVCESASKLAEAANVNSNFSHVLEAWIAGKTLFLSAPSSGSSVTDIEVVRAWEAQLVASAASLSSHARIVDPVSNVWEIGSRLLVYLPISQGSLLAAPPIADSLSRQLINLALLRQPDASSLSSGPPSAVSNSTDDAAKSSSQMRAQVISKISNKTLVLRLLRGTRPVQDVMPATPPIRADGRTPMTLCCVAEATARFPKTPTVKELRKAGLAKADCVVPPHVAPNGPPILAEGDLFVSKVSTADYQCMPGIIVGAGNVGTLDGMCPKTVFALEILIDNQFRANIGDGAKLELTLDGWSRATFCVCAAAGEGPVLSRLLLVNTGFSIAVPIRCQFPFNAALFVQPTITSPLVCEVRALLAYGSLRDALESMDLNLAEALMTGRPPGFHLFNDVLVAGSINLSGATFAALELHSKIRPRRQDRSAAVTSLAVHTVLRHINDSAWTKTLRTLFGSIYCGAALPQPSQIHPLCSELILAINWQFIVDRLVESQNMASMLQRPLFAQIALPLVKSCIANRKRGTLLSLVRCGWDEIATDEVSTLLLSTPEMCPLWLLLKLWSISSDANFSSRQRLQPFAVVMRKSATSGIVKNELVEWVSRHVAFATFPIRDIFSCVDLVRAAAFSEHMKPALPPRLMAHILSYLHPSVSQQTVNLFK